MLNAMTGWSVKPSGDIENKLFELQLFDDSIGEYIPVETGEDPYSLMNMGKGLARRVINALRGTDQSHKKPLPLKPRVPYGLSGKPRKYKPETMIEPADVHTLAERAIQYYMERSKTETNIPVYVWQNSQFEALLWRDLGPYKDKFTFIRLDPDEYLNC